MLAFLLIGVVAAVQAEERVILVPLGPQNSPPAQVTPPPDAPPPVVEEPAPPEPYDAGVPAEAPQEPEPPPPTVVFEEQPELTPPPSYIVVEQEPDAGVPVEEPEVHRAVPIEQPVEPEPSLLSLRGAFEQDLGVMPSGFGTNGVDFLTGLRPVFNFTVKDLFMLELGPTFRLRVMDFDVANRPSDVGQVLRGADWDELSDFGQIVQVLSAGKEGGLVYAKIAPQHRKTMGLGHLLWSYSSQTNIDYHPTGGELVVNAGPVHGEFFASDVLGGRIFAAEAAWDIGGTFSQEPEHAGRYVLAFSFAHDAGRAGIPFRPDRTAVSPFYTSPVTLFHVDTSAVVYRTPQLRWMLLGGLGVRANDTSDLGLVLGSTIDASVQEIGFSARLELRKSAAGWRYGYFGPQYELQRFSDIGLNNPGINDVKIPDSGSLFLELRSGVGSNVSFSAAAEYYFWQRLDIDGTLSLALLRDWLYATVHLSVVGILREPRTLVNAGFRWRVFPSFYVMAEGGTVFTPQTDGTLLLGGRVFAGAGVDFER